MVRNFVEEWQEYLLVFNAIVELFDELGAEDRGF